MAECLLHLNIVGDRYVHVLEKRCAEARARGMEGTGSRLGTAGWESGFWQTQNRRPSASPSGAVNTPAYGQPVTAVMPTFLHLQGQLALQLNEATDWIWRA